MQPEDGSSLCLCFTYSDGGSHSWGRYGHRPPTETQSPIDATQILTLHWPWPRTWGREWNPHRSWHGGCPYRDLTGRKPRRRPSVRSTRRHSEQTVCDGQDAAFCFWQRWQPCPDLLVPWLGLICASAAASGKICQHVTDIDQSECQFIDIGWISPCRQASRRHLPTNTPVTSPFGALTKRFSMTVGFERLDKDASTRHINNLTAEVCWKLLGM